MWAAIRAGVMYTSVAWARVAPPAGAFVLGLGLATALAGCSGSSPATPADGPSEGPGSDGPGSDGPGSDGPGSDGPGPDGPSAEDCTIAGDEDGNGVADCKDPACAATPGCSPACGNGIRDPDEQCDDGNAVDGDACESNCTLPFCGNGITDRNEQCDDGNAVDGDDCESNCALPFCGNGITDRNEQCDDGNQVDGDECESNCALPFCGNGITDRGEQCDDGNGTDGDDCESNCALPFCGNGIPDRNEQCDDGNTSDGDGCNSGCLLTTFAYVKASNSATNDQLGTSVALSSDGSTLAVGAIGEASGATGINGDQNNNAVRRAGAVYIYTHNGLLWTQQAYIKASNTGIDDEFGTSVAISADGSTLAVGALGEASGATGVNGDQTSNTAAGAGAVYVFTRAGTAWSQQAYIKASNTNASDNFGGSLALSASGSMLAVGAAGEASAATGIGGNQADNSIPSAGAVYVFSRTGTAWGQQAYIKASNTDEGDGFGDAFGYTVALSADGGTLAVGAVVEDSAATGIGGNQANNDAPSAGAVYVFVRANTWSQQAYIKASNADVNDTFGTSIALSADGATLAVGASGEDSAATGINGNQRNESVLESGAAYLFTRRGVTWSQQAYIKASNTSGADQFGWSLALSADGSALAIGAVTEDSAATGIGGDQGSNAAVASGAVYTFSRSDAGWGQRAYVKASNTGAGDQFGHCVAISQNRMLVVAAVAEDSAATGINGNQTDNAARSSGAVYVIQ